MALLGDIDEEEYFNPRTHEECDVFKIRQIVVVLIISIHALTRSATQPIYHLIRQASYFNPRTHEECDTSGTATLVSGSDFNPRTHEECD